MLQFKGTYVFKENGKEIGRSSNLITTSGRSILMQYLCNLRSNWAADLSIGAINTTPTVSDTQLNFETGRYPVTLKTFTAASNGNPDLIVVRSTIPEQVYANIYEVGVYPVASDSTSVDKNNEIIENFSDVASWSTTGTVNINEFAPGVSSSPRIGKYSARLSQSSSISKTNTNISMSGYTSIDYLEILAYNTVAGTVTVTLTDISGATETVVFTVTTNSGYSVLSHNFSSSVSNFSYIQSISIETNSACAITIDALKVKLGSTISVDEALISKSVLNSPIVKNYNVPLDIEYYIELL